MQVAAVILAAGASSRFGRPKQLAPLGTATMLFAVCDLAHRAGLRPVIAVVPPGIAVPPDVVAEVNPEPAAGLSRSLRLGLAAVPAELDAAVVLLGDQPTLPISTIRALLETSSDRPIIASSADGRLAPPVLLRRTAFGLADDAVGDEGLRSVLDRHPGLVANVEVAAHPPDVDTPMDLESLGEACPGCGARFLPLTRGTTHEYIGASAACWAAFGELIAREFQDPGYGWIHRHTVDVYAVQHPGVDGKRQRQSISIHLIGLCHWLEHGLGGARLNPITRRLAREDREWPWLDAPAVYGLTVLDALAAEDAESHGRLVRGWAESVWQAWSAHHELVRRWASEALD